MVVQSPTESVQQFRDLVMPGNTPQPRTVLNTAKMPYQAKSGTGNTAVFDNIRQGAATRAPLYAMQAQGVRDAQVRARIAQGMPSSGGGGLSATSGGGGAGTGGVYGLTPQAGAQLQALQAAYKQQFGTDLPVNSGGRTRAEQEKAYADYLNGGNLAAKPGTSVHETGRAADFGGAANSYGPQHSWLVANAPKFGWTWAGKNFSQVEPWHFEFQW